VSRGGRCDRGGFGGAAPLRATGPVAQRGAAAFDRQQRSAAAFERQQRGAAAVEFALATGLVCVLLLAGVETGRLLWTWNAAVDATRHGARLAVVCDRDDSAVVQGVVARAPGVQAAQVRVRWLDAEGQEGACTEADCHAVRVELAGVVHRAFVPVPALQTLALPPFATTLRREAMRSVDNPDCQ
jgi:Flp pilus assembly protein TadG